MAVICDAEGVYQIIDGKQRLSAMIGFYKGMFSLMIDGKEYLFNDLTEEYQRVIAGYHFAYYIVHEESLSKPFTDQDKIDWFIFINFAGTPQERTHLNDLHSSLTSFKAKDIADAQQAYSSENKPLPPFPKDREVYDQAD